MDTSLIDAAATTGVPAPFWFIQLFKVLGFTLHAVPMGLWYAGVPVVMLLSVLGRGHGKRLSSRLMLQMPLIVAAGVNLGVVPLLFVQVAYPQYFYSATILMAWFWFGIVVILIAAYYGVYLYASGLRQGFENLGTFRRAGGWCAAVVFLVIGFVFANAFSLMTNVGGWLELWNNSSVGGAALGTALNVADPTLWPRWQLMFALSLTTTAVWIVIDAAWFAGRESDAYRAWARGFAWKLYTVGVIWFVIMGSWYAFGTWSADVQDRMIWSPLVVLTLLTALAPALPWALMFLKRGHASGRGRRAALLLGLSQFAVLGLNAVSRQFVQNIELSDFAVQWSEAVEYGPVIAFLVVFLLGLAVIAWMIAQVIKGVPASAAE